MFTEEGFPSLERKTNAEKQISTKPFIQPTEVLPDGTYKPSSQAEEVLNWQTTNSIAQNNLLKVIEKKVDKLAEDFQYMLNQMSDRIQKAYVETKQKIEALEKDREKAAERSFHENSRKEQELQKLKRQVFEIEDYVKTIAKPPPEDTYTPFPISPKKLITSTIVQYPTKPPFLPPNLPEQTTNFGKRTKKIATTSQTISPEESKDEAEPLDQLMVSFDADSQRSQDSEEEEIEKPSWLTEDVSENASDEEYADLTNILMASNENGEASTSTPGLHTQEINTSLKGISGTPLFSLDDIPPKLWRKRLLDFKSWMDAKMISPDVDRYKVIEEFCARMTGKIPRTHGLPGLLPPKKKKIRSAGMTPKKKIRSTGMIPSSNTLKDHGPPGLLILKRIQLDRTQKDKDYVTRLYDSSTLCRYQVCLISFMSSSNLLYVFVKLALSLVNFMFCQK